MRFTIYYLNHYVAVTVEDITTYLRNGLRAAGHEAYLSPYIEDNSYNILVECFTPEFATEIVRRRQSTRARFIVVATEFTDGRTFNPQAAGAGRHYDRTEYWQRRFDNFLQVAAVSDAVWCMTDLQAESYRALLPDMPVFAFPRGFDPGMELPFHAPPERKDIDLLFTGTITDYRRSVMMRLQRHYVVIPAGAQTLPSARRDLIARAKVSLHINLLADAAVNSVGRHHFSIMAKSPMLSERSQLAGDLDSYVETIDAGVPTEQVMAYLESGRWKSAGEAMYERYRRERPLGPAVASLLKASLTAAEEAA